MGLSPTQSRVLDLMRAIRTQGEALIPAIKSRACDQRLSELERKSIIGVCPDGEYIGNCTVRVSGRVSGASIKTLQSLAKRGLVQCDRGVWYAVADGQNGSCNGDTKVLYR